MGWMRSSSGLEVHLPQLVGTFALQVLHRLGVVIAAPDQVVTQRDAVDRAAGQLHPRAI